MNRLTSANAPQRPLGMWTCTALCCGNMIGSGIFLLPASLAPFGAMSVPGWLLTCGGAIMLALVFGRLIRLHPRAGGPYAYARAAYGDFTGFLVAWSYWLAMAVGNAAIAVAFTAYLAHFWPALARQPALGAATTLTAVWVLTAVNARGIGHAGRLQVVTTVLKLIPLAAMALFGIFYLEPANFQPINPSGMPPFQAISAAAALTLWSFLGLEAATVPARDVADPARTIPRATMLGVGLTAVVYLLGSTAVLGVLPRAGLASDTAPFASAATALWGGWAGHAVAIGALISTFGALNGWILIQGQIPLAAARDGLFPRVFARVSANGTPVAGLVVTSTAISLAAVLNYSATLVDQFTFLILMATLANLVPYLLTAPVELLLRMRRGHSQGGLPVRALVLGGLAWLYAMWAVYGTGQTTVFWGFLALVAGIPIFVWLKWQRLSAKEALERSEPGQ